jgi:ribosome recycling factor
MDDASVRSKMQNVVTLVSSDIGGIRTGRATPSLIENLVVAVYGGQQKLKVMEVGTITAPDPTTLVIDPWDKSIIGDVRKGIMEANIGMNPAIDGQIIRITFPPLTTEDREKYVKNWKTDEL